MLGDFKIACISIIHFYRNLNWRNIPLGYLWLLLILVFLIKQLICPHHILDSQEYLDVSKKWGNAEFVQHPSTSLDQLYQNHRRTPFYSALIFIGGQSFILPLLLQCLAVIYLPLGVWKLNQKWIINQESNSNFLNFTNSTITTQSFPFAFWGCLISWPLFNYYSVIAVPEVLTSALIILLINNTEKNRLISVVITALLALKPVFVVLLPVIIVFLFKRSKWWIWLLPIGFLTIWSVVGKRKLGFYSISSITVTNPYDYNRKLLLSKHLNEKQIDQLYEKEAIEIRSFVTPRDVADFMSQKVNESIIQDPFYYGYLHLKGIFATLLDPGRYDAMVFWNWEKSKGFMGVNDGQTNSPKRSTGEWMYIVVFLIVNTLKLILILVGGVKLHRILKPAFYWLLIGLILLYLMSIGPVGSARYLIPLYGILAFFGGWGSVVVLNYLNLKNESSAIK